MVEPVFEGTIPSESPFWMSDGFADADGEREWVDGETGREPLRDGGLLVGCDTGFSEVLTGARLDGEGSVALLVFEGDLMGVTRVMSRRGGSEDSRKRHPLHEQQY